MDKLTFTNVTTRYHDIWELRDKRVDGLPMLGSPFPTIFITLLYLFIVKIWGPRFMKNREPFHLRPVLIFYNFAMVIINIYIHTEAYTSGVVFKYNFMCEPCDYTPNALGYRMIKLTYVYYITKFVDFFDTIFFVLRKKFNQISVLHVFHHSVMPMNSWVVLRFAPGGHGLFPGFVNSLVHAVMYTYYGIASLGPKYHRLLWWKRYVTILQMIQFVVGLYHMIQPLFRECNYPLPILIYLLPQGTTFLILFINFYIRNYSKPFFTKVKGHAD